MVHQKQPVTQAGLRLRSLRESCGKTQLEVELESSLGIGYLQRLELGKVQYPERDTLARVLEGIGANYRERSEILGLFGYAMLFSIPDAREMQAAVEAFKSEIEQSAFPAYLLDCAHRVQAWNSLTLRLFADIDLNASRDTTAPRMFFDSGYGITIRVLNPDTFFSEQIRILDYECHRWQAEIWYGGFVDQMRRFDLFDRYWSQQQSAHNRHFSMRPTSFLELETDTGMACFHLIAETFAYDSRFRIIHYVPANPATVLQCQKWKMDTKT